MAKRVDSLLSSHTVFQKLSGNQHSEAQCAACARAARASRLQRYAYRCTWSWCWGKAWRAGWSSVEPPHHWRVEAHNQPHRPPAPLPPHWGTHSHHHPPPLLDHHHWDFHNHLLPASIVEGQHSLYRCHRWHFYSKDSEISARDPSILPAELLQKGTTKCGGLQDWKSMFWGQDWRLSTGWAQEGSRQTLAGIQLPCRSTNTSGEKGSLVSFVQNKSPAFLCFPIKTILYQRSFSF